MKKNLTICFVLLVCFSIQISAQVPTNVSISIVRAEDERRFDKRLEDLLKNQNEKIRLRAALAAGRIGDERAVPMLISLLENDTTAVRTTAVFALGEIESVKAADAILKVLKVPNTALEIRARLTEAAGKIAAANAKDLKAIELGKAILDVLDAEASKTKQDRLTVLLGLTAILRVRPDKGEMIAAMFLTNIDPSVRADAANTLSRLKAKNANAPLRAMLLADSAAIVRANAARALGAAEDADAFDSLLKAAASDEDSRVRVSAIRALGSLNNAKAADKLLQRGETLLADYKKSKLSAPIEKSELLEIATTLGRILPNTNNEKAVQFLIKLREADDYISPEAEIAFANVAPELYSSDFNEKKFGLSDWRIASSRFQGLAVLTNQQNEEVKNRALEIFVGYFSQLEEGVKPAVKKEIIKALPDIIRSFATFKTPNLEESLINLSKQSDVFVRAAAAELLGEQAANKENVEALKTAFAQALEKDKDYNDAQLAILSALVKLNKAQSTSSLQLALDAPDYLVRRHAANLIRQNGLSKDFPNAEKQGGTVKPYDAKSKTRLGQILNTYADYTRAVLRKNARAILTTDKGIFTIEFTPEDAPLTVDNFIRLAKANYFDGLEIHRVVPNFVVQDGDPRGDGNGGPGWQIRDEMNMQAYERGTVGMALSGKDTGGSQWFVTHSPQPHLDGGYTVFGRVNETDMKIVDNLVRGDKILSVKIVEGNTLQKTTKKLK